MDAAARERDYTVDAPAAAIAARLIGTLDDFNHLALAQPAILYVRSVPPLHVHGARANACIGPARVQAAGSLSGLWAWLVASWVGDLGPLTAGTTGDLTDGIAFLCFFDAGVWDDLEVLGRERLVYHELSHLKQKTDRDGLPRLDNEGRPVLALVPHDYEFFDAEVRRYGPALCDLEPAAEAIAQGRKSRRPQTLRRA